MVVSFAEFKKQYSLNTLMVIGLDNMLNLFKNPKFITQKLNRVYSIPLYSIVIYNIYTIAIILKLPF